MWLFVDFNSELKITQEQWEICILIAAYINKGHPFTESLLLEALQHQPEILARPSADTEAISSSESMDMLHINEEEKVAVTTQSSVPTQFDWNMMSPPQVPVNLQPMSPSQGPANAQQMIPQQVMARPPQVINSQTMASPPSILTSPQIPAQAQQLTSPQQTPQISQTSIPATPQQFPTISQPSSLPMSPQQPSTIQDCIYFSFFSFTGTHKAEIVWTRFTDHILQTINISPLSLKDLIRGLRNLQVDVDELKQAVSVLLKEYETIDSVDLPVFRRLLVLLKDPHTGSKQPCR